MTRKQVEDNNMGRSEKLTVRANAAEKQLLLSLAVRPLRTPSGTVRFLIREAARGLFEREAGPRRPASGSHSSRQNLPHDGGQS